jgi:hypothetical protein
VHVGVRSGSHISDMVLENLNEQSVCFCASTQFWRVNLLVGIVSYQMGLFFQTEMRRMNHCGFEGEWEDTIVIENFAEWPAVSIA